MHSTVAYGHALLVFCLYYTIFPSESLEQIVNFIFLIRQSGHGRDTAFRVLAEYFLSVGNALYV